MEDEDEWNELRNEQTIAASLMLALGLVGFIINLAGVFLSFRVRALRSPFGRLMAAHCTSDAAILAIFSFWCAPRTFLGYLDHDSLLSRKIGQLSLFFWFTSIYSQLVIAINRITILLCPSTYDKMFHNRTHFVILAYWIFCLLHACVYFGDGCDFYFNSKVFHWVYAQTPCGQAVGFWLDFIFGCTVCAIVLILDIVCLIIVKKHNKGMASLMQSEEKNRRSKRELQFITQACCTGFLFTAMLFSFHFLSKVVSGVWAVAATTTLIIIVFVFNNELRKVLSRPSLILGIATIPSKEIESRKAHSTPSTPSTFTTRVTKL